MQLSSPAARARAWILTEPGHVPVSIWGLTTTERLRRGAEAAGIPPADIGVGPASEAPGQGRVIVFRSDYVFDDRLVRAMVLAENTVLRTDQRALNGKGCVAAHVDARLVPAALEALKDGSTQEAALREAGVRLVEPNDLAQSYTPALRQTEPPYLLAARAEHVAAIERRIFEASYKGVTDLVTKWVWPTPARWATRLLAKHGVRPNAVTACSWVLVTVAGVLFAGGRFGWGLAAGWFMTFLDTVDGKLARVTLRSSRVGDVLDHGLDLLHPPLWYLAWGVGIGISWRNPAVAVTVCGYVVGRAIEGLFLLVCKTEIHTWRPVDSRFRTITARRNPNMILLTIGVVAGRPDLGLVCVAAWTAASVGFHTVRLVQGLAERLRGHAVVSWMSVETAACQRTGQMSRETGGRS